MNVKVPLLLLLALAAAAGYAFGTERGRARRELILVRLGRKQAENSSTSDDGAGIHAGSSMSDGS